MQAGSSQDVSEARSSKLRLSLDRPAHDGYYLVGSVLSGRAAISSVDSFTSVELLLSVRSKCSIMGKDRWQTAQALNSGGIAAVVLQQEDHQIYEHRQVLWPQRDGQKASKEKEHAGTVELSFDVTLPAQQPPCKCSDHLQPLSMPSSFKCGNEIEEYSKMYILWSLSLIGHRSGLLKRAQKLSLDLPVAAPPTGLPAYTELMLEDRDARVPLTFKGADHLAIQAKIELTDGGEPIHRTPCDVSVTASWWLVSLTGGEPPHDSLLQSLDLKVEVFLSRYAFTQPIDKPNSGQPFEWSNQREVTGQITTPAYSTKDGTRQAIGKVTIGEHCVSFRSCGAAMNYRLHARLSSTSLSKALLLQLPVTLTHAPRPAPGGVYRRLEALT